MKRTPSHSEKFLKSKPCKGSFFPAVLDGSALHAFAGPTFFCSRSSTKTDLSDRGSRTRLL